MVGAVVSLLSSYKVMVGVNYGACLIFVPCVLMITIQLFCVDTFLCGPGVSNTYELYTHTIIKIIILLLFILYT